MIQHEGGAMKYLLIITTFFSLGVFGQSGYSPNDGKTSPGTFNSKDTGASTTTSESGVINSSGVTTEDMNTSPNRPPTTDKELLEDTTLSKEKTNKETGPFVREGTFHPDPPQEVQAQEEDALDYSTTPQKKPLPQPSKNK